MIGALVLVAAVGMPVAFPPAAASVEDPVGALVLLKPKPAPAAKDFQVPTPDDRRLRLSDFKGKVVLLNFWATWCKPCEEEMPSMERLHRKFKDRGLVVLAISMDGDGASVVTPFVRKHKLTFPVGLDPKMALTARYGVWSLPSTFIIDRSGRRVLAANGPREWDSEAADALFESMLK